MQTAVGAFFIVLSVGPIFVQGWIVDACHDDANCRHHTCPQYETPYCSHRNNAHCACRATGTNSQCRFDADCQHHHHCGQHETHHCSSGQCTCQATAIDGGWSAWSSTSSCSTTCGDGVRVETRTCTYPAPMHGGRDCSGERTRHVGCTNGACPTTTALFGDLCTSDLNCTSYTCHGHQHPFCEPYPEWAQCGCTECTSDDHCPCSSGMIGICRDEFFERKCECKELTAIDGGWSAWLSTSSCSTTCGDGVRVETRTCTQPAPMHGGRDCSGERTRNVNCTNGACPTTTGDLCTSDLNCTSFTCPGNQHPFCEPYLDWSQCGCTECTSDDHCSCPSGMIGNCRDEFFEKKCECLHLTAIDAGWSAWSSGSCSTTCGDGIRVETRTCTQPAPMHGGRDCSGESTRNVNCTNGACPSLINNHCTNDADCGTHQCTENLRYAYCHENIIDSFDLSTCDCRECSEDSHCQCQSGLIPQCQNTTFGNTCQCIQSHETSTPSKTEHTTIYASSGASATSVAVETTSKTTTTTTTTTTTKQSTTPPTTTGTSSTLTSNTTISATTETLPISTTEATHITDATPTNIASTTSQVITTPKNDSIPENLTTVSSNTTSTPCSTTVMTTTTTTTTQPQKGKRKCHVCGDYDNQISCDTRSIYLGNLQECAPGADFCMTDIIHDGDTYPTTYKRCVTEEECRNKWLHQTSDLDQCTNYGNVLDDGQFSCHFCCTSDGCNSAQVPDKSTLYTKA